MKRMTVTALLLLISVMGLTFSALALDENQFIASGSSDIVSSELAAQADLRANAQAKCPSGSVSIQLTATQYVLYPRAYPIRRFATALFSCRALPADAGSEELMSSAEITKTAKEAHRKTA